jgi:hypothetical protein
MAGLSFNDMEALRDPVIDEIAWTILQILNSPTGTINEVHAKMISKQWRSLDVCTARDYLIFKGWASVENGVTKITPEGENML